MGQSALLVAVLDNRCEVFSMNHFRVGSAGILVGDNHRDSVVPDHTYHSDMAQCHDIESSWNSRREALAWVGIPAEERDSRGSTA